MAAIFGLTPGTFFDLTNGWDFSQDTHRASAWKCIKDIGAPPYTMFSMLQELTK